MNTLFAHTLQNDNQIGVLFHIVPDDEPLAGDKTTMSIEIKDPQGVFDPTKCICAIVVTNENHDILLSHILFKNNADSSIKIEHIPIEFPTTGQYNITASGIPRSGALFNPFNVEYSIEISGSAFGQDINYDIVDQNWNSQSFLVIFVIGITVMFALIARIKAT